MAIARKKIPSDALPGGPPPGSVVTVEMVLTFLKEDGHWKFAVQTFGMDPAKVVACKNIPKRATIREAGLNPDLLAPYALVEIKGFPHRSDKQEF